MKCKVYSQVFASIKLLCFSWKQLTSKLEMKREQHWCRWLTIYPPFYFIAHWRGPDTLLGIDFCIYNRRSWLTVSSYTMVAQWSIRGYFGALVKQQKRKGNPSAENTGVIEKKHCDSPMVRVWKLFQESWTEIFPCWVVNGANDTTV